MNPRCTRKDPGLTLIELLAVIAIIALLAGMLLPALNQAKSRAKQARCLGNLRQVGAAFHSFAHEHNSLFPMSVPTASGGSLEFASNSYLAGPEFYFSFRHFVPLGTDLGSPALLVCPADTRSPAPSLPALKNYNLSYFVGINSRYGLAESVLVGDRNVAYSQQSVGTLMSFGRQDLRWTSEMHHFRGNLLFADGHAVFGRVSELNSGNASNGAVDIALPSRPPGLREPSPLGKRGNPHISERVRNELQSAANLPSRSGILAGENSQEDLPSARSSPNLAIAQGTNAKPGDRTTTPGAPSGNQNSGIGGKDTGFLHSTTPQTSQELNEPQPSSCNENVWVTANLKAWQHSLVLLCLLLLLLVLIALVRLWLNQGRTKGLLRDWRK